MIEHEIYMKRCLQLAKNGLGTTYPNPLVGSVIVHNGKIIGEEIRGYRHAHGHKTAMGSSGQYRSLRSLDFHIENIGV